MEFGSCVAFLLFLAASEFNRGWYVSLGWPWDGLFQMGTATAEIFSPFVLIYLVILAMKLK